ncbi:ankyrin repeat domain-containing protein [Tetragenococcus halophilus]|uniref:Ankyrin repeat domain-containing protein n=1 Tax=Tetragenococcus halophilus (strain DSM 20338 / JCM 20259 / NCIMB 9735 / NBRC 12172) TaxID=945021 RepID=A0AAN1VR81_TETHN|nr:ankyrin repeat domain-containing protein [Tetragenococcus halophilus]MDN6733889.1 ankyrin repeat domain-containing protein [Tetragenococcus koreensis]QXN87836.1 ankyrin repeat domain-containing protein [Tetragenococcus halophilus]BAK94788.1 hypothetical protein TEH_14610 [Tetragenococcus halophilus NBRC 12172]GFK24354.1 hypothetical protein YA163_14170 [Tetragenococcus halophilus]GFK28946.1 hypothetical protein YG2_13800 [Tetragenococcus halophilus]
MKNHLLLLMCVLFLTACSQQSDTTASQSSESEEAEMDYPAGSLIQAVKKNDLGQVKAIVETEYKLDEQNNQGETPLLIATHNNQVEIAEVLILAGADINLQDHIQDSAYLYAAAQGKMEILSLMLEFSHPDQEIYNRFGGNSLIPAAEKGHLENIKLLLQDGAVDINHQNNSGYTALIEAVALRDGSKVYQEIVAELLKYDADKSLRDNSGRTAEDYARELGYQNILEQLQ